MPLPEFKSLRTPRLRLEPWSDAHTPMLVRLAGMPAVTRHIGDGAPWAESRATSLAAANREHWRRHGFGWRAAIEVGAERPVGLIALGFPGEGAGIDVGEYELGWWLDPSVWGRGYAREGALAVRDEAFTTVGAPSLVARIQPANAASMAVAAAVGLIPESEGTGRVGEPIAILRLTAPGWRRATAPRILDVSIEDRTIDTVELPGDEARAPIAMLHEGLGSVGLWRDFPRALQRATGRRTIVFSRWGHGRSATALQPRRCAVTTFHHDEALRVLPQLLDQVGARRPLLVGHSDGASIALIHAGHHPVSGLVLIAPHVFVEEMTLAAIRDTRRDYQEGKLRERMLRHHDNADAAFAGWSEMWLDPDFAAWNLEDDVRRLDAPMLLIQDEHDPYGTLEQLDRIEARARGPVRRVMSPGGHSPHLEHPQTLAGAVAEFAAGLP